ncbi:MAG: prefoldin subunit alpha [Promethearchaeati archaeon SRVP18_Atabeyarchaeia-1]
MSETEAKYQKLLSELRLSEDQLSDVQSRLEIISSQIQEHINAGATMNNLKDEQGREALIPIGAQVYIRGSVSDTSRVLIGLGAGISVEKTVDSANAELQSRIANMQKIIVSLRDEYAKLAEKVSTLRAQLGDTAQQILKDRDK